MLIKKIKNFKLEIVTCEMAMVISQIKPVFYSILMKKKKRQHWKVCDGYNIDSLQFERLTLYPIRCALFEKSCKDHLRLEWAYSFTALNFF